MNLTFLPPERAASTTAKSDITSIWSEETISALRSALPSYLIAQRWFGAKSRTITEVKIASALPLLASQSILCLVEVVFSSGPGEVYQLPLALAGPNETSNLPAKFIVATLADGSASYDACLSATFRSALIDFMARDENSGTLSSHHAAGLQLPSQPLASRISPAEQSNTSIFFGSDYVLKLYRRVQIGENPDVEISRFLAEQTSFRHTPEYFGELRESAGQYTLAFLQAFAANEGDAWEWFSKQLENFLTNIGPATEAHGSSFARLAIEAAAVIGKRTAELHQALATPTDNIDFMAESFTATSLVSDSTRIHSQMTSTLDALKQQLSSLAPALQTAGSRLLARREQLLEQIHEFATAMPQRLGKRIRIHGDFHLGQLLRTTNDFLIVDFEGEPARPIELRRQKDSPLRDVAGMLRSFSYVAASAAMSTEPPSTAVEAASSWWEQSCSTAFLDAYREFLSGPHGLLPRPAQSEILLRTYLLEKSLYELMYELNNRPSWAGIPLKGVLQLLEQPLAPEAGSHD